MTTRSGLPDECYDKIVAALVGEAYVSYGSPGKSGFGATALQVRGKIFAMLDSQGKFVVKLPRQRVEALVAARAGQRIDPGHGRVMKEWIALEPSSEEEWVQFAREALAFVGAAR